MKRSLAVLTLTLFTSVAGAATQAQLILKGLVAPILEISMTPETTASALDLSSQVTDVKVATLTERSNYHSGYKIKVKSSNGGKLVNTGHSNSFVNYALKYNGTPVPLNTSPSDVYSTSNLKGTFTKELKVSYAQPVELAAGSYEDTIQFSIEAN